MTDRPPDPIDRFADRRVLVIGDPMLDGYLEGVCGRVCPEAPVPVVELTAESTAAGGAANVAVNVAALGAHVMFLAATGDDPEADELGRVLSGHGIDGTHLLRQPGRRTLAKRRVMAAGQVVCRLDQGHKSPLDAGTEARLVDRLRDLWPEADAVILSDYGYGVLTPAVIASVANLQRHHPRTVVADSKRLSAFRSVGPTVVKPNYLEAVKLLGEDPPPGADRVAMITEAGSRLFERTGAGVVAVTLDTDGAVVLERGRPPYRTYAEPRPHSRASGAGDTYAAALALALAAGTDTPTAAELAAAAATVVVGRDGTACCTARELRAQIAGGGKLLDHEEIIVRLAEERKRGRRVVLTNGCFDLLHRGHVTYLSRAKALGDVLVVGLNTDAGIRRVKGPGRPINTLDDRLAVLAALSCVDYLVAFGEDTPHALIRAVRPDVFVKGGDYTRDRLPEAGLVEELGGQVRILSLVSDRSTTGLIQKIRAAEGDDGLAAVVRDESVS
jgi:D-beta-D-heptose 7-phosphate kinase/D-beta-D-heptose 1-phosphate adenosyltransferase